MIRYSLTCPKSHAFEAWFPSSEAFDKQAKRKLVACPACGSTKVTKALMAPNVVTSEKAKEARAAAKQQVAAVTSAATAVAAIPAAAEVAMSPEQRAALRQIKEMRDKILANSEYVGPRFAEEARRIHEEPDAGRGIHGEASLDDVKGLLEDGIEVFPVPVLPDDQN